MDGASEVYSNIFPSRTGHGCHAQRLSLLWHAHHLAQVAVLSVRLHHFVLAWKPHSGTQVLLGLGDTQVAFVIPKSPRNFDSWTTSPPTTANSVKVESYCGPNALFSCAVKYPLTMASFMSDSLVHWVCFFPQRLSGDCFRHWWFHFGHDIFLELFHGLS